MIAALCARLASAELLPICTLSGRVAEAAVALPCGLGSGAEEAADPLPRHATCPCACDRVRTCCSDLARAITALRKRYSSTGISFAS